MKRAGPYLYSIFFVAASTGLRILLARFLGYHIPYITYFAAIMLSAWLGGFGAGLLATILSAGIAYSLFIRPQFSFALAPIDDMIGLLLFCITGLVISILNESLRRQRAWAMQVLNGIGDGVIVTDAKGMVELMNPVAEELTGWTQEQAHGVAIQRVFTIFHEETRRPVEDPVERVLRDGSKVTLAERTVLRSLKGIERPVDDSGAPLRTGTGRLTGAVLVFRDVSERRRLEQEVECQRQQLSAIIESITDEFSAFDRQWRFVYVNGNAAASLGQTRQELLGQVVWDVMQVIDPVYRRELENAMQQRVSVRFRTFHALTHRWIETRAFPSDFGLSAYSSDVTDAKRNEDAVSELAAIVNESDDAIVSHDLDGIIQTWNRGAESLYGYTAAEAIGQNISILTTDTQAHEVHSTLQSVLEGNTVTQMETLRLRKDGTVRDVSINTSPIRNARGEVTGASHVARDITSRKKAEEAYRESMESLRLAVRAARMGTWRNEIRLGRVSWSPELEEIFGLAPGTFAGTEEAFFSLVHPDDRAAAQAAISGGIASGTEFRFDFRFFRADGECGWMEGRGRAFYDADGRLMRLAGVGMDITDRKRAEEEVLRNVQQLARANADLQQFAYVASHDLQEPLRTISSFSQLLQRRYADRLDPDASEFLGYLVGAAQRLSSLVSDLLVYARLGSIDDGPLGPVDLNEALGWATNNLKSLIEESGAVVVSEPLPTVQGERVLLVQVFQNLISNAIKYRGDEQPRIHVSAKQCGQEWTVALRDNGIGIAVPFHEKIFGLFQRLHTRKYSGTGIGLAICKRIVESHGGRIWVESVPGHGATFYFSLPIVESQRAA